MTRIPLPLMAGMLALPLAGCGPDGARSVGMAAPAVPALVATLADAGGVAHGTARIEQTGDALHVTLAATGLPPGVHGVHLHAIGKCDAPGFTTAGGHWNPTGMKHGRNAPMGPHEGDLPNITIGADGSGALDATLTQATLGGIMDGDGTAIIVHAGPDDYVTDPSGNSGGRIACGILAPA